MLKTLRSNKGFSLVELMIVVAIIGILASVAIPNFQRFQRKARQSEARSLLSGMFQAQKSAFAEWNGYPGNFVAIGFQPDGQVHYRVTSLNFPIASIPAGQTDAACVDTNRATCLVNGVAQAATWTEVTVGGPNIGTAAPVGCAGASTATTFTACASGNIGTAVVDTWGTNEKNLMTNPTVGL